MTSPARRTIHSIARTGSGAERMEPPSPQETTVEPRRPTRAQPGFEPRLASPARRAVAATLAVAGSAIARTLRYRWLDPTGIFEPGSEQRVIFSVWHNRLAVALFLYQRHVQRRLPGRRMAGLVSASRDGALLTRVLELRGVLPIRGSSSRRGGAALRELSAAAAAGFDLAITPDGPRGPRYQVQPGAIAAGYLTGLPVVPVGCRLGWAWRLRTWDGFQIPFPFSVCEVHLGTPMRIPREATERDRERFRSELESAMRALNDG